MAVAEVRSTWKVPTLWQAGRLGRWNFNCTDYPAAGRIHVDVLEVRRNASDRSGNEIVSLPPGQQVNVILNTLCASEDDGFQPFPNPSIGRRAFLMAEQFATSPEKILTNQPQSKPSIILIYCYFMLFLWLFQWGSYAISMV